MDKNEHPKLYVVTIHPIYHYDEGRYSHLPTYKHVFGIYSSEDNAYEDIYDTFETRNHCKDFFYPEDIEEEDNDDLDFDVAFKFTDETYGGYAYYCVKIHQTYLKS